MLQYFTSKAFYNHIRSLSSTTTMLWHAQSNRFWNDWQGRLWWPWLAPLSDWMPSGILCLSFAWKSAFLNFLAFSLFAVLHHQSYDSLHKPAAELPWRVNRKNTRLVGSQNNCIHLLDPPGHSQLLTWTLLDFFHSLWLVFFVTFDTSPLIPQFLSSTPDARFYFYIYVLAAVNKLKL